MTHDQMLQRRKPATPKAIAASVSIAFLLSVLCACSTPSMSTSSSDVTSHTSQSIESADPSPSAQAADAEYRQTTAKGDAEQSGTWNRIATPDFIVGAWTVSEVGDVTGYSAHTETYSSSGICSIYDEFSMTDAELFWEIDNGVLTRTTIDGQSESLEVVVENDDIFEAEALDGPNKGVRYLFVAYYRP